MIKPVMLMMMMMMMMMDRRTDNRDEQCLMEITR